MGLWHQQGESISLPFDQSTLHNNVTVLRTSEHLGCSCNLASVTDQTIGPNMLITCGTHKFNWPKFEGTCDRKQVPRNGTISRLPVLPKGSTGNLLFFPFLGTYCVIMTLYIIENHKSDTHMRIVCTWHIGMWSVELHNAICSIFFHYIFDSYS